MIHYVCREHCSTPVRRLRRELGPDAGLVSPLSYERLFYLRAAPVGHYVFTDFDRLSPYEIQAACAFVAALREAAPGARVLNDPHRVLERYPLLRRLRALGLNDFDVTRVDGGERPPRYPVFLRLEDDCRGPDTPLLHDEAEFLAAIERLPREGKTLKRRIAVGFCAEPDAQGRFLKYGALGIGGRIIPQHLLRSGDWNVKRNGLASDEAHAQRELDYIESNPHAAELARIFELAGIDFGRIDYGLVGGRIQTYEINTNPTFPALRPRGDGRDARRALARTRLLEALAAIGAGAPEYGTVRFRMPRPRLQRPPRPASLAPWRLPLAWLFGR